jgi:hypothetical protein
MPVQVGPRLRISDLIQKAKDQGCELRQSKNRLVTPYGFREIRFIFNPANRGRFDLTDYKDDESMLASEIEAAARRLVIDLP